MGHSSIVSYNKRSYVLRHQMALAGKHEQVIRKKKTFWGEHNCIRLLIVVLGIKVWNWECKKLKYKWIEIDKILIYFK